MRTELREKYKKEVYGTNKDRDYSILELSVLQPDLTYKELVKTLGIELTEGRISAIFTENQSLRFKMFAALNPLMLKEGRAIELVETYLRKKKIAKISNKDFTDILEQLRKEIEGDKPLIDASTHNHFISIKHFIEGQVKTNRIPDAVNR